jgi:hypothetical protein
MTFSANGTPVIQGDGTAMAVITGDIVDEHDNRLGDAHDVLSQAVADCEDLLRSFDPNAV